jgi:hypothetical protein
VLDFPKGEFYVPQVMGVATAIVSQADEVEPGESVSWSYRIRNSGQVVDRYMIDVVGVAGEWATAEPAEVNLFPGGEEEVRITFAPPRSSSVLAGDVAFAIRIVSGEDTAGSAVVEGTIRVLPFDEMKAELVPRTIRLKRRGTTELAVDNAGNTPRTVQFFIEQEEDNLRVVPDPTVMDLAPGKATFANVLVRPKRTFWRGQPKTLPFQVAVLNEDRTGPPVYADGVVVQEQLLPKWLLKLLLALLAAALVLFVLWQTVFKSVIESTAKDAVKPQVAAATDAANQAKAAQTAANGSAQAAKTSADQAATSAQQGGGGGTGTTTTIAGSVGTGGVLGQGTPTSFSLSSPTTATPVSPPPNPLNLVSSPAAPIPNNKQLLLTDVVFENAAGDSGVFQIKRDNTVLFQVGLNNFRDLDYHFVTPLVINGAAGQTLTVAVACQTTVGNVPCTASAFFTGVLGNPPPP